MSDFERLEDLETDDNDWSTSRIKVIGDCGRKYKYKYIDKAERGETAALAFGSAIHKCLENIQKEQMWEDNKWQRMWFDLWFDYQKALDWDAEKMRKSTYDNLGFKILEQYTSTPMEAEVLGTEIPFRAITGDGLPLLRGIIDKIVKLPSGRFAVIDYKTSKMPPDPLLLRADPQLTIYHSVATERLGESPVMGLHHLRSNTIYWTERTPEDMDLVRAMLKEGTEKVRLEMFSKNIGYNCNFCDFKKVCLGPISKGIINE